MTESDISKPNEEKYIWLTKVEYETLIDQSKAFSDYQRLGSVVLIIGIAMVFLHIAADIFFHLIA